MSEEAAPAEAARRHVNFSRRRVSRWILIGCLAPILYPLLAMTFVFLNIPFGGQASTTRYWAGPFIGVDRQGQIKGPFEDYQAASRSGVLHFEQPNITIHQFTLRLPLKAHARTAVSLELSDAQPRALGDVPIREEVVLLISRLPDRPAGVDWMRLAKGDYEHRTRYWLNLCFNISFITLVCIGVLCWMTVLVFSLVNARCRRSLRRLQLGCCPNCNYDLTGAPSPSTSCPECGSRWEPPQHSPGSDT